MCNENIRCLRCNTAASSGDRLGTIVVTGMKRGGSSLKQISAPALLHACGRCNPESVTIRPRAYRELTDFDVEAPPWEAKGAGVDSYCRECGKRFADDEMPIHIQVVRHLLILGVLLHPVEDWTAYQCCLACATDQLKVSLRD